MKVLVIGSGGGEHALVWKLSQSPKVDKIFCAPGNAGIAELAECLDIKVEDIDALLDFVRYEWIDLTVAGPEAPPDITDIFRKDGLRVFGPPAYGARLEGSKAFAKDFMVKYRIPTSEHKTFTSYLHAEEHVRLKGAPIVIKADRPTGGRDVFIAESQDEAINVLKKIMKERMFNDAGNRAVMEQYLKGEEASFMVLTDGRSILSLATSYSIGGMVAYSPAPVITERLHSEIMSGIMNPILKGLKREGIDYRGVIYVGLMICNGKPYVLDLSCCFGDPEAQPVLMRLKSDLFDVIKATVEGRLREVNLSWRKDASVCVVISSKGYPGSYEKGKTIKGLDTLKGRDDLFVFHAGTSLNNGEIVTSGGRVLGVTALGRNIRDAKNRAYKAISKIHFDGMHYGK